MILPMKSKEIHQRFGDHKTLMNDFSTTLRDLWAWLYDFQKTILEKETEYLYKNVLKLHLLPYWSYAI